MTQQNAVQTTGQTDTHVTLIVKHLWTADVIATDHYINLADYDNVSSDLWRENGYRLAEHVLVDLVVWPM